MDRQPAEPVFSTVDTLEVETADQRPVRPAVFVTLVLGIVSAVAILGKPLVVFPVLTVGLALYALRPSRSGPPVARWAAVAGAALAVFFGTWGWTRAEIRQRALAQQATQFAHDWLVTLGQGDKEMAIELASHDMVRQPETMPLRQYYATEERAKQSMQTFLDQEEVQSVLSGGSGQRWEPVGAPHVWQRRGADHVRIRWQETAQQPTRYYWTELVREWDAEQQVGQWRVEQFAFAQKPD